MAKATVPRGATWVFFSAAATLAALVALPAVARVASQPLRPWKPPSHLRDPHNGGLSVNMDDQDPGSSRLSGPELVAPDPIPGIIVWSLKRTGSTDFVTTMLEHGYAQGLGFSPLCSEDAESFARDPPTKERIYTCLREIPEGDGFITHLHPGSIDNSMTSELSTPFDVFKVLQQQGATVLVVIHRSNFLARAVDTVEARLSSDAKTRTYGTAARNQAMYDYFREFSEERISSEFAFNLANTVDKAAKGDNAGQSLRMSVVRVFFNRRNDHWACDQLGAVFDAAVETGILSESPSSSSCMPFNTPPATPWPCTVSLRKRVGPEAAKLITDNMENTTHKWMLDTMRETPPSDNEDGDSDDSQDRAYNCGQSSNQIRQPMGSTVSRLPQMPIDHQRLTGQQPQVKISLRLGAHHHHR